MMQVTHLPALRQLADVQVVAVADLDKERAIRLAQNHGIPAVYASAAELATHAAEIDCAIVVTQKEHHAQAILPLLAAGVPVFTEKPLAHTLEDGEQLVQAVERTGTPVMVGYMKQFDPGVVAARNALVRGEIGTLRYARLRDFGGNWTMGAKALGTLPLADPAPTPSPPAPSRSAPLPLDAARLLAEWEVWVHDVNLARHLFGEPQEIVYARHGPPRLAVLDHGTFPVLLEMGQMTYPGGPWDEQVVMYGTEGRLELDLPPPLLFRQTARATVHTARGACTLAVPPQSAFTEELRYFIRCIARGEYPRPDAAEALADLRLCSEIVRKAGS